MFHKSRPDASIKSWNETLLSLVIGPREKGTRRKWDLAEELLKVDNGPWNDPQHIYHCCGGLFCCPGGIRETRSKVWSAVLDAWA